MIQGLNNRTLFQDFFTGQGKRVFIFCSVLAWAFTSVFAQTNSSNATRTSIYNTDFETVDIIFEHYIELEIQNSDDNQIHLLEVEQGEYKDATKINAYKAADTLVIKGFKQPTFEFPEGKLSAHKVIDSRLVLQLPKNKTLIISTQEAQIFLSGSFNDVFINQLSGSCKITDLKSDLQYVSIYGDVSFYNQNHQITYSSKSQKKTTQTSDGKFNYRARIETIHGKIIVI